jgi:hypothetical protein
LIMLHHKLFMHEKEFLKAACVARFQRQGAMTECNHGGRNVWHVASKCNRCESNDGALGGNDVRKEYKNVCTQGY